MSVSAPEQKKVESKKAEKKELNISDVRDYVDNLSYIGPSGSKMRVCEIVPGINYRLNFWTSELKPDMVIEKNSISFSIMIRVTVTDDGYTWEDVSGKLKKK